MHVSGGTGHKYRAHFRRDWPTHQAFPILWPYRVLMLEWNVFGFPSDLFDNFIGGYSQPGVISTDGQEITYLWESTFLFETARLFMSCRNEHYPTIQTWRWLFTDNVRAGFALVTYAGYAIKSFTDIWETNGPFVPGPFTFDAVGEFHDVIMFGSNPYFRMTSLVWDMAPDEDKNP